MANARARRGGPRAGGLTPWWFWLGYHGWRTRGCFRRENGPRWRREKWGGWAFGLAPFGLVGWGLRQQSLGRATAPTTGDPQMDPMAGLAAMGAGALAWALNPSEMAGMAWLMTGFCVAVTWSVGVVLAAEKPGDALRATGRLAAVGHRGVDADVHRSVTPEGNGAYGPVRGMPPSF